MRPAVKTGFLLIFVLIWPLVGCGQLPRPFAHEETVNNQLLDLKDRAGITVPPIEGDSPGDPMATAEAMAEALRRLNIPASISGSNQGSQRLEGRAVVLPLANGGEEVLLYWDLRLPGGERRGIHSLRYELPSGAWRRGDTPIIARLVADVAPAVASMVQTPLADQASTGAATTVPPPDLPKWRLVLMPLRMAPGDAERSLPRALERELRAAKLPVSSQIGQEDLLVLGSVILEPPENGLQKVAITWRLVDASDNKDLGEITQNNQVPAGSLDGPWGATAREIAQGAVAGMISLLGQAGKL